jgi:hypothetical protein
MIELTNGDWSGEHVSAQHHALEQSKLLERWLKQPAKPDAPVDPDAAGGSSAGSGSVAAAPRLTLDEVAADVLALFTAAKGLSRSVLIASRLQEHRGRNPYGDYDGPDGGWSD